ncbi:hypothetical protein JDN40_14255 [Rhodomicrobium vannielii ATCC 17100]|uniref:hypothetical protein n=1 Tax=Rhodomicrobium vannielii TaxID=1069 RepID=UPI001919F4DC|nr:hypothetical protein [Rhodomicrobium vannielii]MBJ7535270.1 hypothetical protein [Rhodomicrobium vannielii ATCC 17100]
MAKEPSVDCSLLDEAEQCFDKLYSKYEYLDGAIFWNDDVTKSDKIAAFFAPAAEFVRINHPKLYALGDVFLNDIIRIAACAAQNDERNDPIDNSNFDWSGVPAGTYISFIQPSKYYARDAARRAQMEPYYRAERRKQDRQNIALILLLALEAIGSVATFVFLTFFDGYIYNTWNWLIAIPVNSFLSFIWPIYWLILRPIMGN